MPNAAKSPETKTAYGPVHRDHAVGCIDWLTAITSEDTADEYADEISTLLHRCRPDYKGVGSTLKVDDCTIWLKRMSGRTVLFSFNPTPRFKKWRGRNGLKQFLQNELGEWSLKAQISRLDHSVTLPLDPKDVFCGIDFGPKRFVESTSDGNNGRTVYAGRIGRRKEVLLYDKMRQSRRTKNKIEHQCTRLEINYVPKINDRRMKVEELPFLIEHKPFRQITRYEIELTLPKVRSCEQWRRFGQFEVMCERESFVMARRVLSKRTNKNFVKLYSNFFERTLVTPNFDQIYNKALKEFFR